MRRFTTSLFSGNSRSLAIEHGGPEDYDGYLVVTLVFDGTVRLDQLVFLPEGLLSEYRDTHSGTVA
jgi:hypothetical protein